MLSLIIKFLSSQLFQMQQMVGRWNQKSGRNCTNQRARIASDEPIVRCRVLQGILFRTFMPTESVEKFLAEQRDYFLGSEWHQSKRTSDDLVHRRSLGNIKSSTSPAANKAFWLRLRKMLGCDRVRNVFQCHEMSSVSWRHAYAKQSIRMEKRLEVNEAANEVKLLWLCYIERL